jgi:hypothetical protein
MNEIAKERAEQIKGVLGDFAHCLRATVKHAMTVGQLLCEQRAEMDAEGGGFVAWLKENVPLSKTTAYRWMELYEHCGQDESQFPNVGNLGDAYRLLEEKRAATKPEKKGDESGTPDKPADSGSQTPVTDAKNPRADAESPPLDADGREIPGHLGETFAEAKEFRRFAMTLSVLKGQVARAVKANPRAYSQFSENAFRQAVGNAYRALTMSAPHIICSYCGGEDGGACRACGGTAFLSKAQARCVPREMRTNET